MSARGLAAAAAASYQAAGAAAADTAEAGASTPAGAAAAAAAAASASARVVAAAGAAARTAGFGVLPALLMPQLLAVLHELGNVLWEFLWLVCGGVTIGLAFGYITM